MVKCQKLIGWGDLRNTSPVPYRGYVDLMSDKEFSRIQTTQQINTWSWCYVTCNQYENTAKIIIGKISTSAIITKTGCGNLFESFLQTLTYADLQNKSL